MSEQTRHLKKEGLVAVLMPNATNEAVRTEIERLLGFCREDNDGKGDHGTYLGPGPKIVRVSSVHPDVFVGSLSDFGPDESRPVAVELVKMARQAKPLTRRLCEGLAAADSRERRKEHKQAAKAHRAEAKLHREAGHDDAADAHDTRARDHEEAVKAATRADADSASTEELEAAANKLAEVEAQAEAEDLLSTEEREEHDKAILEDIVDRQGIDGVASMLRDICHLKAEHLRSNWQDETSAATMKQCAEELDSFIGWYYGLGD